MCVTCFALPSRFVTGLAALKHLTHVAMAIPWVIVLLADVKGYHTPGFSPPAWPWGLVTSTIVRWLPAISQDMMSSLTFKHTMTHVIQPHTQTRTAVVNSAWVLRT